MKRKMEKIAAGVGIVILSLLTQSSLRAQTVATISGTITDSSRQVVPHASVSIEDVDTGQSIETRTDSAGVYTEPNLAPGNYTVSVAAEGLSTKTVKSKLTGATEQSIDLALNAAPPQQGNPANQLPAAPQPNAPNAPSNSPSSLSLQDLGFTSAQTQGSAQRQALLNKRTHMLKVHQTLGLITAVPMFATLISGPQAKAKGKNGQPITEPTSANLDLHIALGGLTTGLYFTTAYYAMFAPKIPGVKPKGAIRLHRDLEWIHGPGMIATPILGIMAYKQENAGEKVHGIASAHAPVAYATAIAYGAAIVAVSWPIHWKFWER
ncbi:MAG TPA: carboxypeptidase-like regulatory domain-containing protein [Acidobacteriaceae bacterium]|nr:carboxypeptidase-like regulatory domain-containing protein [Acidobacteriaceae bacterium]